MNPKVEILIVTFSRDFSYLQWCFRSIVKFCTGFSAIKVLVPNPDFPQAEALVHRFLRDGGINSASALSYNEWPKLGFLHHMAQIMQADVWCPAADFILHMDADCIFTSPVTPETYIKNGKPYMRYEYFSKLGVRHPGAAAWQEPTQRCLPFLTTKETMRCHPGVYHKGLYAEARRQIELKVKEPWEDYVKKQRNEFPQGISEFNVLGNVALHCFPDSYEAVEQIGDRVTPDNYVQQFHAPDPIDRPQSSWVQGAEVQLVPLEFIREALK